MVTYGKGGWTWDDVYNLPIHLRTYYMNLLVKAIERESGKGSSGDSSESGTKVISPPHVKR